MLSCLSHVQLFVTPRIVALQAPLSIGFSRQEYRSGLTCPPLWDFPDPGIEPASLTSNLHWLVGSLPLAWPGKPNVRQFSSVQFSRSVVTDSLRPHELQHARPPCPSPALGAYSNSCPSSRCCHPAISSSVVPFSSCPQSLPASGSFPMSQLFAWGGQSTGASASVSAPPMNTQDWSPLGWTGWISLQSKGLSRVFLHRITETTLRNSNNFEGLIYNLI